MAEEVVNTPEKQEVVVPEFLKGMKGFDENNFKKEITEIRKTEQPAANTEVVETPAPVVEKKPGEEGYVEKKPETTPAAEKEGDKPNEEVIKTGLFGEQKLGVNKKAGEEPVVLKEFSDIEKYVKSNYGVDDVNKALTEIVPKWREQAQKGAESEKKYGEIMTTLDKLDEDIIEIMKANLEGKDWRKSLTDAPKINFNKKVEDYNKKELVNHYFPGKFTDEDFIDGDEENKGLDIAYEAAIKSFNNDKTSFESKRAALIADQNKQIEAYEKSITSSVEDLRRTLPHINDLVVKETGEILKSGGQGILSEFLNNDGTLKPDAAQKLAMARHGLEALNTYMGIATRKAETEIREEFVSKAPDKLAGINSGGENKLSERAKSTLEMLKGIGKKSHY